MSSKSHPSKAIIGKEGDQLKGKRIVLCITGSVAAIKCPRIARQLMRFGAEVFTVMSASAQRIIHPNLMEWATGNPVITRLTGKVEHVTLTGNGLNKADLILVAPATANTISKIAYGIADTPVTIVVSAALGSGIRTIIVPAMHEFLYRNPILQDNIRKLKAIGVKFIEPRIEEGKAKIALAEEIVKIVIQELVDKNMARLRLLVTAGPTIEYIDPIRIITNKSSGKMGIAIAEEAMRRGADVTLILGAGIVYRSHNIKTVNVETTKEMYDAVMSELKSAKYDVLIAASAVADFVPERTYRRKLSTNKISKLTLRLKSTRKIVDDVKKVSPNTFLVAFKAEYGLTDEEMINCAYRRLKASDADLIVANDVSRKGVGFRVDTNEVFIIDREKRVVHVPLTSKREVARKLLDLIVEKLELGRTNN